MRFGWILARQLSPIATASDSSRCLRFKSRSLDSLLNLNAHSNWIHTDTETDTADDPAGRVATRQTWADGDTAPTSPLGLGMGVAEINMSAALSTDGTDGEDKLAAILNERYSGDPVQDPPVAQVPGNGETSFRSRAKLFGYPDAEIDPADGDFGTVGGLFGTSMDIHGRFRYGFPNNSRSSFDDFRDQNFSAFNNSLPQISMLTSDDLFKPDTVVDEFSGNPYEMSLSGKVTGDSPFTPDEFERLIRSEDIDAKVLPQRLTDLMEDNPNPGIFTTESYEVPMLTRDFVQEMFINIRNRNASIRNMTGDPSSEEFTATLVTTLSGIDGQFAFAPELFRGLKMDINRPFGDGRDNNGNGVFDEPGEAAVNSDASTILFDPDSSSNDDETRMELNYANVRPNSASSDANPRVIFARQLYMLAMLLMEPVDLDKDGTLVDTTDTTAAEADPERLAFARAMAQWAVNVVDFRDADSINTRFVYDPFPWDASGWSPPTDGSIFVWGAERPELLLSETLAVHIQNIQVQPGSDPDTPTYEQRLRPQPFAYFEVYNPWTQNRLNQRVLGNELYSNNNGGSTRGVNLGKTAPDDSPVWRFEVERLDTAATATEPAMFKPLRYVYMTDPTSSPVTYDNDIDEQEPGDIEIFFNSGNTAFVQPGRQAVIGTRGFEVPDDESFQVYMGRTSSTDDRVLVDDDELQAELDKTTRLVLSATDSNVRRYTGENEDTPRRSAAVVFIDRSATGSTPDDAQDRKFALSDPQGGYPNEEDDPKFSGSEIADGFVYDEPTVGSLDQRDGDRINDADVLMIRSQDGTNKNFRYVRLQRLANPLIAWNAATNPYLTIDSMEVDLVSFNGADPMTVPPTLSSGEALRSPESMDNAVSHERGSSTDSDDARAQLWGFQREAMIRTAMGGSMSDGHFFTPEFDESLGRTNDSFDPENGGVNPFSWLTWNNRPFVSHMEILNVPYLAPDRLTYAPEAAADERAPFTTLPFTIDNRSITDIYGSSNPEMATRVGALAGRYGHLLSYFAAEDDLANTPANQVSDIYKLLDFIEVPSRFVGNEAYYLTADVDDDVFKHPFNTISRYRVPGKININMIPPTRDNGSAVWDALLAEYAGGVNWNALKESLYGDYIGRDNNGNGGPDMATDVENPFRPVSAANLVPGGVEVLGSGCSLMRSADAAGTVPLFDYTSTAAVDNSMQNAAFRNGLRTRLGNMVTTKSSVYACWITVGYFEVDSNDNFIDSESGQPLQTDPTDPASFGIAAAAEIGGELGEQVRNRVFFIFDRSIPVAFEPGKNHNVDDAVLVKSLY